MRKRCGQGVQLSEKRLCRVRICSLKLYVIGRFAMRVIDDNEMHIFYT